ncbi:hypothetical protein [Saccharopolyspora sp. 5N708]|uniref:hypothetical protein n=1 Tax=Saccharopolyspora sp. 5N708 TaxID=3457424 RepID=UPI003FD1D39D
MAYNLGVDLGTTFTAAAIEHFGQVEMLTLGDRAMIAPTVPATTTQAHPPSTPDRVG